MIKEPLSAEAMSPGPMRIVYRASLEDTGISIRFSAENYRAEGLSGSESNMETKDHGHAPTGE